MRSPGTVQRDGKPVETPADNAPLTQLSEYHCRVQREVHSAVSLEVVLMFGRRTRVSHLSRFHRHTEPSAAQEAMLSAEGGSERVACGWNTIAPVRSL